jgi:hypothetical protein
VSWWCADGYDFYLSLIGRSVGNSNASVARRYDWPTVYVLDLINDLLVLFVCLFVFISSIVRSLMNIRMRIESDESRT